MIAGRNTQTFQPQLRLNVAPAVIPTQANAVAGPPFSEQADMLQTVAFYMGLAMAFTRFAMLQEIQTAVMHFKGYLLYVFGIPAIFGMVMAGGLQRTLKFRTAYYWVGYALWIFACVPFSTWRSDSLREAMGFARTNLVLLFVIAGLTVSWRQCRLLVQSIAVAAVVNLASSRIFGSVEAGDQRLGLDFGMVANANDFAAHLLMTLPFLLLVVYSSKSLVLRAAAILGVGFGILTVLKSGSRGSLVALLVVTLYVFLRGSTRDRIALACLIPLTLVAVMAFVPGRVLERLRSFSASSSNADRAALESSQTRAYLLRKALEYTFEFPLFGVGPAQFPNYEGTNTKSMGTHGYWHETHNSWLEASSECGIPGGLLFLGGWTSSLLLVNRTYRKAKTRPDCQDIQNVTFCTLLAIIGFCMAVTFLNFAYFFYGPAVGGLAIALSRAADGEFERRSLVAAPEPEKFVRIPIGRCPATKPVAQ